MNEIKNIPVQLPIDLSRVDPRLIKAAKGFEAHFMKQMVRAMRSTVQESEATRNNKELQLFRGMLDDHYVESVTNVDGIGIAQIIIRHLLERTNSLPTTRTSGNSHKTLPLNNKINK